jgi:hypothetical protein
VGLRIARTQDLTQPGTAGAYALGRDLAIATRDSDGCEPSGGAQPLKRVRWVWLPIVALGIVRQWVYYGPWAAIVFAGLLVLCLMVMLRFLRATDRPGRGLDLLALFFGFAALASLTSAPFANTSTHGIGVATSRHTALGSAAVAAVCAAGCWLLARRADLQDRRGRAFG